MDQRQILRRNKKLHAQDFQDECGLKAFHFQSQKYNSVYIKMDPSSLMGRRQYL